MSKNLIGERFGSFLVIDRAERTGDYHSNWLCLCDCGNVRIVLGTNLTRGKSKKCKKCKINEDF